ncbi:hypothetical protein A3Q56_06014 [Intoshia linei]|uniref:Serpin domain-containing protein n=1 Tax=Intoshia linei TaxID=1819745 RepID=A0A177AWA1_9BILA|nr:hypothetical protein A3Q56_06014 [Intoshia linei]
MAMDPYADKCYSPANLNTIMMLLYLNNPSSVNRLKIFKEFTLKQDTLESVNLYKNLYKSDNNQQVNCMKLANKMYLPQSVKLSPYFIEQCQKFKINYKELIDQFDENENVNQKINQWIASKTNQQISIINSIKPKLVIVNAMCFNSEFVEPFYINEMTKDYFYPVNGNKRKVVMLNQIVEAPFVSCRGSIQIRLKYQLKQSYLIIVIPHEKEPFTFKINKILQNLEKADKYKITLAIPKFYASCSLNFKKIFKSLEVSEILTMDIAEYKVQNYLKTCIHHSVCISIAESEKKKNVQDKNYENREKLKKINLTINRSFYAIVMKNKNIICLSYIHSPKTY